MTCYNCGAVGTAFNLTQVNAEAIGKDGLCFWCHVNNVELNLFDGIDSAKVVQVECSVCHTSIDDDESEFTGGYCFICFDKAGELED